MPKRDIDGREYIEQDGKRYYQNVWGQWEAEKDWLGNDKVETDWLGNPKIETDWLGNQKVETDWLGKPLVAPEKKDDNGGCYLTTACMSALQDEFRDNCAELTILRQFRDTYVRDIYPDDIVEYYKVAPLIVSAINHRFDRQDIYVRVYEELVLKTIGLIKQGLFENAYQLYKDYSGALVAQYC